MIEEGCQSWNVLTAAWQEGSFLDFGLPMAGGEESGPALNQACSAPINSVMR
jgi:hypothetical protein